MDVADTPSPPQPPSTPVANVIASTSPCFSDRCESPLPQTPETPHRHSCSRLSSLSKDSLFTSCGLAYFSPSTEAERVSWELHGGNGEDGGLGNDPFTVEHEPRSPSMSHGTAPPCQAAFVDPDVDDSLILSLARHPISLYRAGWVDDCVAAGELLALEPYIVSKVVILERPPQTSGLHSPTTTPAQIRSIKAEPPDSRLLSPFRSETPVSPTLERCKPNHGKSPKLRGFKPRLSYVDSPAAAARLAKWHQECVLSSRRVGHPFGPISPDPIAYRSGDRAATAPRTPMRMEHDLYTDRKHMRKADAAHSLLLLSTT